MKRITLLALFSTLTACGGVAGTTHAPDLRTGSMMNPGGEDLAMAAQNPMDDLSMDPSQSPDMAGCATPSTLHPAKAGQSALYCPFAAAAGAKAVYCTAGQHCCEPSSGMSSCSPLATPCPAGDTDWQCEDPVADCTGGKQCCATGTLVKNTDQSCANYASGFKGSHCAASCAAGEIQLCTADAECSGGKICLPFKAKGSSVGGCY